MKPKIFCITNPEELFIVEQRREVVAYPKGCDGQVVTAIASLRFLPKTKATEELLSFLIISKLEDRQPLYHLERQLLERHSVDCSRQTIARWVIDAVEKLLIMARKNFLFSASVDGAHALCVHFSIIRTAKLHGAGAIPLLRQVVEEHSIFSDD